MIESFNHAKNFLDKCLKGILINDHIDKPPKNPKISAIITLHNSQRTVSRALKSVQNQNITDIEIILINDFSNDNTLSIIKEIGKSDPRIRIINNKKNMGTYFSRSIGVLCSKGKYIFHIDNDDMLLDEDVFSTITDIAEKGNFDLISFNVIYSFGGTNIFTNRITDKLTSSHRSNQVLFQPELAQYPFRPGNTLGNYYIIDSYIWNKCVKTKIYKTMLKKVGKNRYMRYMKFEEDRTDVYALFNTAESAKYLSKFGYLLIKTSGSSTNSIHAENEIFICILYFVDISIDFTRKTFENSKLLIYLITFLMKLPEFKSVYNSNGYNKKLINSCIDRILKNKYILAEYKREIIKRALNLIPSNTQVNLVN